MIEEYFNVFSGWIVDHPHWAEIAVFFIALAESLAVVGLVIPGVAMMFAVGALIGANILPFTSICLWATAGAIFGDSLSFWIGRHFQLELQKFWPFRSYPWMIDRGIRFFHDYGGRSLIFGRFFGPVRGVIPLVVGMLDMPVGRFLLISIFSSTIWAPAYLLPGMVFGASLELASTVAGRLVFLVISLIAILWFIFWLLKKIYRFYHPRTLSWIATIFVFGFLSIEYLNLSERETETIAPEKSVTHSFWWNKGWKLLWDEENNSFNGRPRSLTIQGSASLDDIRKLFSTQGWKTPPQLNFQNALHWLNPEAQINQTPILPQFGQDKHEALVLIKQQSDSTALELRLWPSDWVIDKTGASLWIGRISRLELNKTSIFLNLPEEISMETQRLSAIESELKAMTAPAGFLVQTVSLDPPVILLTERRK